MRKIAICVLFVFLAGCAGIVLDTPSKKIAYAKGMVIAVNNSTTTLLLADLITVDEAKKRETHAIRAKSLINAYETAVGTTGEADAWQVLNVVLLELNAYMIEKETR